MNGDATEILRLNRELERLRSVDAKRFALFQGRNEDLARLETENERQRAALEIIAGRRQPLDNLMSNVEIAVEALTGREGK